MKRSNSLRLERLEDRTNPSSLTVSFVPDGTQVGALHSELYQDNAGVAPAVWQQQLLGQLQTALSATQPGVTLTLVSDDGTALSSAAPQDGAVRIAAVNELFASNGTIVTPAAGTDFLVAGGSGAATFGIGLGLVGPGGQSLSPSPIPPGQQTGGSMLPLIMPTKAYGTLYPTPTPVSPAPAPTTATSTTPTSPAPAPTLPLGPTPTSPSPDGTPSN